MILSNRLKDFHATLSTQVHIHEECLWLFTLDRGRNIRINI